jgi:hypothetical protein
VRNSSEKNREVRTLRAKIAFPTLTPASPMLQRSAFDHPDCIFELKHDGFRALAYVDRDGTRLVSRCGNVYRRFPQLWLGVAALLYDNEWRAYVCGKSPLHPGVTAMRYWFRVLSILSVVSGIIELIFWSVDRIERQPFHGKWLLLSSIIWATVFFFLSRWRGITK